MSKLTRQTMLWFGSSSDSSSVGVFGSIAPGGPGATYSKVIATIQSLPAWGSGWKAEVVSPLRPAIQDFNAVDYVFSYGICYLHEMGIPEYDAGTVYYTYSICQYNGVIYQSLGDSNVGNTPTPGAYWSVLSYVDLTTNQTVAGVKTFSSFPVTPSSAPTTNYQVANKKYVDDNTPVVPPIPTTSSYSATGYVNMGGFYVQWGVASSQGTISFPVNFPTACLQVVMSSASSFAGTQDVAAYSWNTTSFYAKMSSGEQPCAWIAVGY